MGIHNITLVKKIVRLVTFWYLLLTIYEHVLLFSELQRVPHLRYKMIRQHNVN